jgi:hypothetical protein
MTITHNNYTALFTISYIMTLNTQKLTTNVTKNNTQLEEDT